METKPKLNTYLILCYLMTFACGFGSSAVQFVKLDLRLYLDLSNTLFATLSTVNMIVQFIVILGLSKLLDKTDNKKLIVLGLSLQFVGLFVGIFIVNPFMVIITNVISGLGYSLASTACYPAYVMIDPDHVTTHVNREQGTLTFGAFISPIIMAVLINSLELSWRTAYIVYSSIVGLILLLMLFQKSPGVPEQHFEEKTEETKSDSKKKIFSVYFIAVTAALFLYIFYETGVIYYSKDFFVLDLEYALGATLCISAIRGGMTFTRMFGDRIIKDQFRLSIYSSALAIVTIAALVFTHTGWLALLEIFLFGFFCGACWTTIFSLGLLTDPSISGKLTSILLIFNTIGFNIGNLIMGAVIDNFSIRTSFAVDAVLAVLSVVALMIAQKAAKKEGVKTES